MVTTMPDRIIAITIDVGLIAEAWRRIQLRRAEEDKDAT